MDDALARQIREVLAAEQFGVLATLFMGRLHTATIHFAETPAFELVHAIRPVSLKAQLIAGNPRVAFQVDNRSIVMTSRERFARLSFEGTMRPVPADDLTYPQYRSVFTAKLPVGDRLLSNPEVGLYVLRPSLIRVAIGGEPAIDVPIAVDEAQRSAATAEGAWTGRHDLAGGAPTET